LNRSASILSAPLASSARASVFFGRSSRTLAKAERPSIGEALCLNHEGHEEKEGNSQHLSRAEAQSTQRKASTGFEPSSFDSLRDLGELCEGRLCPLEGRAGLSRRRRERKEERQPLAKAWTEEGRSWSAFAHVAIACPWCSWRALREVALTFPVSVPVLPILTVA
jgi:hypothetical protein